jgi:hypothetical protein
MIFPSRACFACFLILEMTTQTAGPKKQVGSLDGLIRARRRRFVIYCIRSVDSDPKDAQKEVVQGWEAIKRKVSTSAKRGNVTFGM